MKKNSNPFNGDMNFRRIKAYIALAEEYNISERTVGEIFTKGVEWYRKELLAIEKAKQSKTEAVCTTSTNKED